MMMAVCIFSICSWAIFRRLSESLTINTSAPESRKLSSGNNAGWMRVEIMYSTGHETSWITVNSKATRATSGPKSIMKPGTTCAITRSAAPCTIATLIAHRIYRTTNQLSPSKTVNLMSVPSDDCHTAVGRCDVACATKNPCHKGWDSSCLLVVGPQGFEP